MKELWIYGLFDPSGELRYVGQTSLKLGKRLQAHLSKHSLQKVDHRSNWINSLLRTGKRPYIEGIQRLYNYNDLNAAEEYWIEYFKSVGCSLVNTRSGGNYTPLTEESIQKLRAAHKGKVLTKEHKAAIRASCSKGFKHTPEAIAKISAAHKGKSVSEATRAKLSAAFKGRPSKTKGVPRPPEVVEKMVKNRSKTKLSDEHKAKISKAFKGRVLSEETKRKLSEAAKARWAKVDSEERRIHMESALKARINNA